MDEVSVGPLAVEGDSPLLLALDEAPQVADSAWLAPGSRLLGAVTVGPESSIWYGATVRADLGPIRIGAGSNLQDNVVVHADPGHPVTIGDDVLVGHGAIVHGCSIGDGSLVGMGATVMNGARIGAGALVAAGSLVPEGMEVPAGTLVSGVPARVRRQVTEQELAGLRHGAEAYRRLARRHRAALAGCAGG